MLKNFADIKKVLNFAPVKQKTPTKKQKNKLPCGVMVARRILVPPVRVRILPR